MSVRIVEQEVFYGDFHPTRLTISAVVDSDKVVSVRVIDHLDMPISWTFTDKQINDHKNMMQRLVDNGM